MRTLQRTVCFLLMIILCIYPLSACGKKLPSDRDIPETSTAPSEESVPSTTCPAAIESLDGTVLTLANGDSFYTPDPNHCVYNTEQTVLYYNNLLLVFTSQDISAQEKDTLSDSVGGKTMGAVSGAIHAFQIMVPNSTLDELNFLSDTLMENELVLYACCEYPVQIMSAEDDRNPWSYDDTHVESRGNEADPDGLDWWAEAIGAYTAWKYTNLSQEVRTGIIDNGFDANHEDLLGQITFITNDSSNTVAEHGTMVAGIIGAVNNEIGIRGIADSAKLYCADLWPTNSPDSYHTLLEYLACINYMAQSNVRVINNSWGCVVPSIEKYRETVCHVSETEDMSNEYHMWLDRRVSYELIPTAEAMIVMISQLYSSGYEDIIHVQGAGNAASDARCNGFYSAVTEDIYDKLPPASLTKLTAAGITYKIIDERILVVGSVQNKRDSAGNYYMSTFSNYGSTVDICAPGDEVFSTIPRSQFDICYCASAGTSLSAPMVTASVAFLWSIDPELSVTELRQILLSTPPFQAIGFEHRYPMLNLGTAVENVISRMHD